VSAWEDHGTGVLTRLVRISPDEVDQGGLGALAQQELEKERLKAEAGRRAAEVDELAGEVPF
jgi:hypothetical protein